MASYGACSLFYSSVSTREMSLDRAELTGVFPKNKLKETKELKWNYDRTIFVAS